MGLRLKALYKSCNIIMILISIRFWFFPCQNSLKLAKIVFSLIFLFNLTQLHRPCFSGTNFWSGTYLKINQKKSAPPLPLNSQPCSCLSLSIHLSNAVYKWSRYLEILKGLRVISGKWHFLFDGSVQVMTRDREMKLMFVAI